MPAPVPAPNSNTPLARLRRLLAVLRDIPRTLAFITWEILVGGDTRPTEIWHAATSLACGLWLATPMWDAFASAPGLYRAMSVLPEALWGAAVALEGLFLGAGLYAYGRGWRHVEEALQGRTPIPREQVRRLWAWSRVLRLWGARLGFVVWGFVAAAFWAGDYRATACIVYALYALSAGWIYLRQSRATWML